MTKVFAVNGSPTMEKGDTALLLNVFLQGMEDAGADAALHYASKLDLKPCSCGQMYCWYQNPGECCVQDEFQTLYPSLKASDILVLATPVYIPLPGRMQDVMNRLCPLIKPKLAFREGRTRAESHSAFNIKKIVLVSVGGWWELENFDTVVRIVRDFSETAGVEFSGPVLRPHSFLMYDETGMTAAGTAVLEAARKAGHQLVAEGSIDSETLAAISRPLVPEAELRARYNKAIERFPK
ncbi:flavodoxin family protein [Acidaminobacter hydrogenoformans]|uniref:Multimeric flavodoxin WrbA n=1 Tax=Acidaminobacter hydrogenoformans DSM 2784 TaxID=1120920 RepID=A0A1G5RUN9_9FIRM|nr:flavodoxin family protein [Acidaminobacter hydrogenoformans]SCZ77875.1 Multimeric flavodoxin WrbA [Acidaminobacter hydrogenoformans DSM 2784]